jgi:hypothetical protein
VKREKIQIRQTTNKIMLSYYTMNLEEFNRPDIQERLKSVIIAKMFNNPFRNYNSLNRLEKLNFKKILNIYIKENLNQENWEQVLIKEYNELIVAYMDDPVAFDPSKYVCDTNFQSEFMLSEEQKAFHGDVRSMNDLMGKSSVLK